MADLFTPNFDGIDGSLDHQKIALGFSENNPAQEKE
jgi:hypothetical protein